MKSSKFTCALICFRWICGRQFGKQLVAALQTFPVHLKMRHLIVYNVQLGMSTKKKNILLHVGLYKGICYCMKKQLYILID